MKGLIRSVAVTLGFGLVFLGGAKLNGISQATAPLDAIGIPPSLFALIGWGEIAIGALLTQTALHRYAGAVLALWMCAACGAHGLSGDFLGAVVPLGLGCFGLLIAHGEPALPRQAAWPAPLGKLPGQGAKRIGFIARHVAVSFLVRWAIGGIAFWLALPIVALSHARGAGVSSGKERLEHVLLYLLFYGYGAGGIWNFTGHFFAADMVASSVGWPAGSPFQQELAFYALGTGVVGLLTPWLRDQFWVAAALAPSIFVYGAAYTHVEDFLLTGNDAPMNWSLTAVGANLLIPTVVLVLMWEYARRGGFRTAELAAPTPGVG